MIKNEIARNVQLRTFIDQCFIGKTEITKIQGDAGFRSYFRLTNSSNSYILMDCPTWYCSVEPFIKIADYLRQHNISAPKIIQQNIQEGFLLLEDFGDISIKNHLDNLNDSEESNFTDLELQTTFNQSIKFTIGLENNTELNELKQDSQASFRISSDTISIYYFMIDLLLKIQSLDAPAGLPIYNNDLMINELELLTSWYIPYKSGNKLSEAQTRDFKNIWIETLQKLSNIPSVIVHRDYHSENMMYLPNRQGINMLGILDFQDALFGSPIYDLVSLLEDARIKVPRDLALNCIKYYSVKKSLNIESVLLDYHILGAQRNCRILGVFVRKYMRDKADQYLKYIPLVLEYLEQDLSHPRLIKLKSYIKGIL